MCGIGGIVWGGQERDRDEILYRFIGAMQHRGPDECGIYVDGFAGLAHTRLSILDPASGQQPYSTGDDVLVFNGEIFNFPELKKDIVSHGTSIASNCDTEVLFKLLQRDGMAAVSQLNGQFAFCLYHPEKKTLLLARDAFGEKPLYYFHKDGVFAFSSEIKGLIALLGRGFEVDPQSLDEINTFWAHEPTASAFRDIRSVAPGSILEFRSGKITTRYFQTYRRKPDGDDNRAKNFRELLSDSVEKRMLADVPLGVYLSGGLDSSVVSYEVARRRGADLKSYAIEFEDARFDEAKFQKLMSRQLGTDHRSITVGYDDIVDNLVPALAFAESPTFRTGFVGFYLLSAAVRDDGVKVILTGEGADEIFLGYDLFWHVFVREKIRQGASIDQVRHVFERLNQFVVSDVDRSKFFAANFAAARQFAKNDSILSSHAERLNLGRPFSQMLNRDVVSVGNGPDRWIAYLDDKYPDLGRERELQRSQAIETESLLSGHLLSIQGDRASMAHSVETRAPFLDAKLVSQIYSIDTDRFVNDAQTEKAILKSAYADVLPPEIINRQKFPYRAPDGFAFLKGKGRELCHDLLDRARRRGSTVDTERFSRFLDTVTDGDFIRPRDNHTLIMGLTTFAVEDLFSSPNTLPSADAPSDYLAHHVRTRFGEITQIPAYPRSVAI